MCDPKSIGLALVLSSLAGLIICLFHKRESFFNLREVVHKHFLLFINCKAQYFVFYGLPLTFSIGLAILYPAGRNFYTELSIILGVMLSALLTVLSILSGYDFSTVENMEQRKRASAVVSDTINTIVFDTLLCVFLMLFNLALVVLGDGEYLWLPMGTGIVKLAASIVAYYLFSVICLTFLLIVKQMSKIIQFNLTIKKES